MAVMRWQSLFALLVVSTLAGCVSSEGPDPILSPEARVRAALEAAEPLELGGGGVIVVEGPAFVAIPITAIQPLFLDHVQWTHSDQSERGIIVIMTPGNDDAYEPPACGAAPHAFVWSSTMKEEPYAYGSVPKGRHDLYIHVPEGEARFAFNHFPLDAEPITDIRMISVDQLYDVKARGPNRATVPGTIPDGTNDYSYGLDHEAGGPMVGIMVIEAKFSGHITSSGHDLAWTRTGPECSVTDSSQSGEGGSVDMKGILLAASPAAGPQAWDAGVHADGIVTTSSIDVSYLIVEAKPGATWVPWW